MFQADISLATRQKEDFRGVTLVFSVWGSQLSMFHLRFSEDCPQLCAHLNVGQPGQLD